jgi:hypothetical protein
MNCNTREEEEEEDVLQDHGDEISQDQDVSSSSSSSPLSPSITTSITISSSSSSSSVNKGENSTTVVSPPAQQVLPSTNENVDMVVVSKTEDSRDEDTGGYDDSSISAEEQPTHDSCPICLNPTEEFVSGPCRHSLCVECMELLLNANAEVERWPPPASADAHLSAPTLGRCPICRSALSLFDIVNTKTLEPLYPPDTDSWKATAQKETKADDHQQQHQHQHTAKEFVNNTVSHLSQSLASSLAISTTLATSTTATSSTATTAHPLGDAVYIPYRGMPGELSFHWDWERVGTQDDEFELMERPFLNLSKAIRREPEFWRLDDQTFPQKIRFMEEGCHFHKPSRTFHGTVSWPVPLKGSYEWDIILGFSKDYRFISSGRIHHKRGRRLDPGSVPETFTEKERKLCKHPFDGRWSIVWKNSTGEERRDEIHVINNEFEQSGWSFYFNFQNPGCVFVHWPRSKHRQTIIEGVDLLKQPMGPPVGRKIRWETSCPNAPDLVWIRQTIGPNPVEIVHNYGMGQGKFLYQRLDADLGNSIPKYNGASVFGNVFTKRMHIGSASYHFVSPTESFVSYRHPACRDLPPMDDGSPLPTRVNFHNIEWDPEERRLDATIEWEKDFGTSWNDNVRWKLTMHFDTEYMVILKGGIQCEWCKERRARPRPPRPPPRNRPAPVPVYVPPPEEDDDDEQQEQPPPPPQPGRNEEWVVSGYGYDQLYVNAACLERYRTNQGNSRNNRGENGEYDGDEELPPPLDVEYRALCEQHQKRLEKEGATKRSIGFLTHLFWLADNEDENPIDFLL